MNDIRVQVTSALMQFRNRLKEGIDLIQQGAEIKEDTIILEAAYEKWKKEKPIILSILYCDTIELLLFKKNSEGLNKKCEALLETLENITSEEEIEYLIDEDFNVFLYMLDCFCELDEEYDYWERRNVYLENQKINRKLKKINPIHMLDILFFCIPYTLADLKGEYQDTIEILRLQTEEQEEQKIEQEAIISTQNTLYSLFLSDIDNSMNLVSDLLDFYYTYANYYQNYKTKTHGEELMLLIENKSVLEIIQHFMIHEELMTSLVKHVIDYAMESITYEEIKASKEKPKTKKLEPKKETE